MVKWSEMDYKDKILVLIHDVLRRRYFHTRSDFYSGLWDSDVLPEKRYPIAFWDVSDNMLRFSSGPIIHTFSFDPFVDMSAAWLVLTSKKFIASNLSYNKWHDGDPGVDHAFHRCSLYWVDHNLHVKCSQASANTMQVAICKAALESCGVEIDL